MTRELELQLAKAKAELELLMLGLTPSEKAELLGSFGLPGCEISSPFGDEDHNYEIWCYTHDKQASHSSYGDTGAVCEVYAKSEGCRCCAANRI